LCAALLAIIPESTSLEALQASDPPDIKRTGSPLHEARSSQRKNIEGADALHVTLNIIPSFHETPSAAGIIQSRS